MGLIWSGRVRRDLPSVMEVSTTPAGTWWSPEAASTESSCRLPIKVKATISVKSMDWPPRCMCSGILTHKTWFCCHQSTRSVTAWSRGINPSTPPACFFWKLIACCAWNHHTLIWLLRKSIWCSLAPNFCPNNPIWQLQSPKPDSEGSTPLTLEELYLWQLVLVTSLVVTLQKTDYRFCSISWNS